MHFSTLPRHFLDTSSTLPRPLPNLATASTPAAFEFGYMVAAGQARIVGSGSESSYAHSPAHLSTVKAHIVEKFVAGLGGKTDPVGPSPVIVHVTQVT